MTWFSSVGQASCLSVGLQGRVFVDPTTIMDRQDACPTEDKDKNTKPGRYENPAPALCDGNQATDWPWN